MTTKSIAELTAMAVGSRDPKLSDEEWAERDRKIAEQREKEEQAKLDAERETWRARLVEWGVPVKDVERISGPTDLDPTGALKVAQDSHEKEQRIVVISGPVGCGKTTAAAWWLSQEGPRSPYLKVHSPLFIPVYKLERVSRYDEKAMARIERARRLVIDDLGAEYLDQKNAFVTFLRGLIDARYNNCLPLLVSTNLTADEFKERYGERVVDRLREVGRFAGIKGESLRRKR